jgi:divalent metal cation (Fe/Co/Zn/Cd) transporter
MPNGSQVVSFFALAAYIVAAAGWGLWHCEGEGFSWPGLIVTLLAIPVVYLLAQRKLAVAVQLGSGTLRADAVESNACGWLSFAVALGLLAQLVIGAWWIDSVTSFAILWLLIKEGREHGRETVLRLSGAPQFSLRGFVDAPRSRHGGRRSRQSSSTRQARYS